MGLSTLIQIPYHHMLANEIALDLKYHIGLKQFFNINLGISIIKNYFFCSYFWHISLRLCSNFDRESSLDAELNFTSNDYPLCILLMVEWNNLEGWDNKFFITYICSRQLWLMCFCGIMFLYSGSVFVFTSKLIFIVDDFMLSRFNMFDDVQVLLCRKTIKINAANCWDKLDNKHV